MVEKQLKDILEKNKTIAGLLIRQSIYILVGCIVFEPRIDFKVKKKKRYCFKINTSLLLYRDEQSEAIVLSVRILLRLFLDISLCPTGIHVI